MSKHEEISLQVCRGQDEIPEGTSLVMDDAGLCSVKLSEDVEKAFQEFRDKEITGDNVCETVKEWLAENPGCVNAKGTEEKTLLHFAAVSKLPKVARILLEAGADPNIGDEEGMNVLHALCYESNSKAVNEIVNMIMPKEDSTPPGIIIREIDVQDGDECSALHYAAENGHLDVVKTLLNKGADMYKKNSIKDEPVHKAAEGGNVEILALFIARDKHCVTRFGYNNETPLHMAVDSGDLETVKMILDADCEELDINARSKADETPLHFLAITGKVEIGKLLLERGAMVNPPASTEFTKTPFHKASFYGQTELALFLLNRGAVVTAWAFQDILSEGYEPIARAVIESDQWPLALRGVYRRHGKYTTAFRELIVKMPDVAVIVLNKCTVEDENRENRDDEAYSVLYNYEFVEDCHEGADPDDEPDYFANLNTEEADGPGSKSKKKETFGCSYKEITDEGNKYRKWGYLKFSKADHPLQIMVDRREVKLLKHPVVESLLHYKWKQFGLIGYLFNLLTFVIFLSFLTAFALHVPNPQSPACVSLNLTNITEVLCPGPTDSLGIGLIFSSVIVLLLGGIRLIFEIIQLATQPLTYIRSWVNWLEVIQYICSIIFVVVYGTNCYCVLNWQWQIGVVAVFLGWIGLILFVTKLPFVGIYVIILTRISVTFTKMLVLTILLLVAFGLTFFMIFFDSDVMRSPFSDVGRSLLKTMTMTTGELDYDAIFRIDPAGGSDDLPEIEYPPISYIVWIAFLILMPVILTNMLTSLAVGDTNDVLETAQLEKLAQQVEQVLSMEELVVFLNKCLPKKWKRTKPYQEMYPNQDNSLLNRVMFRVWEGDRYDKREAIDKVLNPPKNLTEELLHRTNAMTEKTDAMSEKNISMSEEVKELKSSMSEIKQTLSAFQVVLNEISRKIDNGV